MLKYKIYYFFENRLTAFRFIYERRFREILFPTQANFFIFNFRGNDWTFKPKSILVVAVDLVNFWLCGNPPSNNILLHFSVV